MRYKKKDTLGKCERLRVLRNYIQGVDTLFDMARGQYKKKDVADDDIIDALCCGVTALHCDALSTLPANQEKDGKGIAMEIVYCGAKLLHTDGGSAGSPPRR